jgi:hypothetical protein
MQKSHEKSEKSLPQWTFSIRQVAEVPLGNLVS